MTEAELDRQLQEFSTGEDDNKAHYRYRALTAYLQNHKTLSDIQVEQVIGLLHNDPDESMASSALISLLKMQTLRDRQFGLVKEALWAFRSWTERHIEKQQTTREKESGSD